MDVQKLEVKRLCTNLQNLKDLLRNLVSVSAELIDRNSTLDQGGFIDDLPPGPRFELLLEDFISSCNAIEINLKTMQECLSISKSSIQNLPITVSNLKCDNLEGRIEPIEPNSTVSYNQYLSVVKYQAEMAKSIKSILDDFVQQQSRAKQRNQEQQQQQQQQLQQQQQQQQQPSGQVSQTTQADES